MKAVFTLLMFFGLATVSVAQTDGAAQAPQPVEEPASEDNVPMKPEPEAEDGLGPVIREEEDFDADIAEPTPLLSLVRAKKSFGIGMRYGLLVAPVPSLGVDAFYQPRSNLQIGLLHAQGTQDFKNHLAATDGTTTEKHVLGASLTLLYARYFVGDSWYFMGGLGQRVVKTDYELRSTTVNSSIKADNTATSTAINIAVGNMWTWDKGFYAAIDWIGYTKPLSSKEKPHSKTAGTSAPPTALEEKRKDVEDQFKNTGKLGTWLYLGFHLGYTF